MKNIEIQDLSPFNCVLDGFDVGTSIVYGKIEVYSCKQTAQDKKLAQEIDRAYQATKQQPIPIKHEHTKTTTASRPIIKQEGNSRSLGGKNSFDSHAHDKRSPLSPALSPPCPHDLSTHDDPFGDSKQKRKTFADLIATLNTSYPDYDFRDVKPEDFTKETNFQHTMNSVNLYLRDVVSGEQMTRMWSVIELVIGLAECDIYSYHPDVNQDADSDPLALGEGKIWTWNYFFYNRKQKRLLFFTCHAKSKNSIKNSRYAGRSGDYDTYYSNAKNIGVHYHATDYDSFDEDEDGEISDFLNDDEFF